MFKKLLILVVLAFVGVGCAVGNAKYGKCYQCGHVYGKRGGNLPGQGTVCARCGGTVYYPPYKSEEYYENKRAYGGTED